MHLAAVQAALARLRGADSMEALLRLAPAEACRTLGFSRALVLQLRGDRLYAASVFIEDDPEEAEEMLATLRARPGRLHELPPETEVIRSRAALLVRAPNHDRVTAEDVLGLASPDSYVSAPIMPEGRVIGLLQANRQDQEQDVDEHDRLALWAFAEGLGYAIERTALRERLRAQLDHARGVFGATDQLLEELGQAELEVGGIDDRATVSADGAAMVAGDGPRRPVGSLTVRETEVIALIASGETNAGIATRLLVSESTVKSHVKHILRKLGASHRAEAVSRYLAAAAETPIADGVSEPHP